MQMLREHDMTLAEGPVLLRPMTEDDWGLLHKWESDPDVLYFSEGADVQAYTLEETQGIHRQVSQTAFSFIIEYEGKPIGYCWLQTMNVDRILKHSPDKDLRRIDLAIGEKEYWGRGIGTEVIRRLTEFGFEREGADALFGCEVADYNPRSLRAFLKNGYSVFQEVPQDEGRKAKVVYDLMLTRDLYRRAKQAVPAFSETARGSSSP